MELVAGTVEVRRHHVHDAVPVLGSVCPRVDEQRLLRDVVRSVRFHMLVAALELRAAEGVGPELLVLHPRPGRPVEDHYAIAQAARKSDIRDRLSEHLSPLRGSPRRETSPRPDSGSADDPYGDAAGAAHLSG